MVNRPEFHRGEVYWVDMEPTVGSEIRKIRPALIVSPDDFNQSLPRVVVAPLTSKGRAYKCRPELEFKGKKARILLDHLRSVDKRRLKKQMGTIDERVWLKTLLQMFG